MKLKQVFFTLVGSSIVVQVVMLTGMLLLARLYSPEDFGDYGFYASIASFVAVISGLRFDYIAFSSSSKNERLKYFYCASLVASVLVTVIAFFITQLMSGKLSGYPGFSVYATIFIFTNSLYLLGTQHLLAKRQYKIFLQLRLFQVLLQIGISITLHALNSAHGLVIGFAASQLVIGLVVLGRSDLWDESFKFSELRRTIRENRLNSAVNTLITGLQYATPFAPVLIGAAYYKRVEIGAYFLFAQLVAAPTSIFRRAMTNFLNAEFADPKIARDHFLQHVSQIKRISIVAAPAILTVILLIILLRQQIITVVLGPQWGEYATFLVPVVIYYLFDTVLQPFTTLLPLWGRNRAALLIEFLRFVTVYGITLYSAQPTSSPYLYVVIGYAAAMIFFYLLSAAVLVTAITANDTYAS